MTPAEALLDEDRRARHVRMIVNFTTSVIAQGDLSRDEAEALVAVARAKILDLFPGREATYDLLYARRFGRLLDEYTGPAGDRRRGVVLPFRPAR